MRVEKAGLTDLAELVELRVAYLREDHGKLDEGTVQAIRRDLPGYFRAHLNRDLLVYTAREGQTIAACAFLLLVEKPMSPAFMSGKTGTVLNVYTRPECRRKGYARRVMEALLEEARERGLSVVELKSTDAGQALYRGVGFDDDVSGYHLMKWRNS